METRVEGHGGHVYAANAKPAMFNAGLSAKFTKRHAGNYHDTTLTAASAAKARAELKMERQANAIEKQREKIEHEMKKIELITERLQRQQTREAKRLRNRLEYAATLIQAAYRNHVTYQLAKHTAAAINIQRHWRGHVDRCTAAVERRVRNERIAQQAACTLTRNLRIYVCRLLRHHEIMWRNYAAITIQCFTRQRRAVALAADLKAQRQLRQVQRHAATRVQAYVRGFLTRLVYLDVLYLICRIQSVARGFLVRKRLRWLMSLDIERITAIQALIRGFLTRCRLRSLQKLQPQSAVTSETTITAVLHPRRPSKRDTLKKPLSTGDASALIDASTRSVPYRLLTVKVSLPSPTSRSPDRIKRSFWLPSGSNTVTGVVPRRRLPRLPVSQANGTALSPLAASSLPPPDNTQVQVYHAQRGRRPRPPPRLEPIKRPVEVEVDEAAETIEQELQAERRKRDETLKLKLLVRKAQERMRLEQQEMQRAQRENEATERKLMEREDKVMKLLLKTTLRKHQELKLRRLAIEQQREERERMDMIREDRLAKLHIKLLTRLAQDAQSNALPRMQSQRLATSTASRDQRDEDESHAPAVHLTTLAFDLRPRVRQAKKHTKKRSSDKPSDLALQKSRELRAVYGKGNQHSSLANSDGVELDANLQKQYASWDFHNDTARFMQAELVEDTAEFDYGDAFDEVVDEKQLKRLLC